MDHIELNVTRWLAVRAQGRSGIRAALALVLWLTGLTFIYLVCKL
jgi:hypothetical protein